MNLTLEKLSAEEWALMSASVHKYSFLTDRDASMDRIDYALLVKRGEELFCYCTIIEVDAESAYIQHGGNLSETSVVTLRGYLMMIEHLKSQYKMLTTRCWNKNKRMLKLNWAAGFEIRGVEVGKENLLFVSHTLEAQP